MTKRVALLSLVLGCAEPWAPKEATPYRALASYPALWRRAEVCAERTGDLDRIRWYAVPGTVFECPTEHGSCFGWWQAPHTIYLGTADTADAETVVHEMLHDLTQSGAHGAAFRRCGV